MRNIIWFIAILFLVLIQAGVFMPLHIAPINLVLIVVVMAVILSDFSQGLAITLIGGILLDFISGTPDGLISMSLVTTYLIVGFVLNEILSREASRLIIFVSVAFGTIIYFLVFVSLAWLFRYFHLTSIVDTKYLLSVQLPLTLMWNVLFAYPVFIFYSWIQNLAHKLPTHEEPIRS
jgi:hypothetical protein